MADINGVINVYKEKGYTSHDVVAKLRGILKTKKIGHTGTLDPEAEGVLPVCIGNATKLCDLIMEKTKTYEAELVLGVKTDTEDMSGEIIEKYDGEIDFTEEEIKNVLAGFIGEINQIPPMYSAIKVNGKKLYDLARQGIEIDRKARIITIYDIEIIKMNMPVINIRVKCGKGTYIRTLCKDIGEKLGVYGSMGSLIRIQSGIFEIKDSMTLSDIEKKRDEDRLDEIIIPTEHILGYPEIYVKKEFDRLLMNGNPLLPHMFENPHIIDEKSLGYKVYGEVGFVGVYVRKPGEKMLRVNKMFL